MKALRFLASRWVLSFVGVAILALLIWFFGPLLPLLEGWVARLVVILCLLVVWAAAIAITGGFRIELGPVRISSRNAVRVLLIAVVPAALAWQQMSKS